MPAGDGSARRRPRLSPILLWTDTHTHTQTPRESERDSIPPAAFLHRSVLVVDKQTKKTGGKAAVSNCRRAALFKGGGGVSHTPRKRECCCQGEGSKQGSCARMCFVVVVARTDTHTHTHTHALRPGRAHSAAEARQKGGCRGGLTRACACVCARAEGVSKRQWFCVYLRVD